MQMHSQLFGALIELLPTLVQHTAENPGDSRTKGAEVRNGDEKEEKEHRRREEKREKEKGERGRDGVERNRK